MAAQKYSDWIKNIRETPNSPLYPEQLVRGTPTSYNLAEAQGVTLTADQAGLEELNLLHRSFGHDVLISGQSTLLSLRLPNFDHNATAHVTVKTNAALASLYAPQITLPTFGVAGTLSSLDFSGNALNAADVDALFNRLALSLSSGVAYYCKIDVSGGTNAVPTAASSLARSSLYLAATGAHITITANS